LLDKLVRIRLTAAPLHALAHIDGVLHVFPSRIVWKGIEYLSDFFLGVAIDSVRYYTIVFPGHQVTLVCNV